MHFKTQASTLMMDSHFKLCSVAQTEYYIYKKQGYSSVVQRFLRLPIFNCLRNNDMNVKQSSRNEHCFSLIFRQRCGCSVFNFIFLLCQCNFTILQYRLTHIMEVRGPCQFSHFLNFKCYDINLFLYLVYFRSTFDFSHSNWSDP